MDWLAPIVAWVLVAGIVMFIVFLLNCGQDTDGHNQFDDPDEYLRAVKKSTRETFIDGDND
jgi:hypothetical protein